MEPQRSVSPSVTFGTAHVNERADGARGGRCGDAAAPLTAAMATIKTRLEKRM